jgi:hypothetical protein
MGITIHYRLSASQEWAEEKVREWLEIVGDYAKFLGCDQVSDLNHAGLWPQFTEKRFEKSTKLQIKTAFAEKGWLIFIEPGEGCQTLVLGLCKYPGSRDAWNRHRWVQVPSGLPSGWIFNWFCKTQFAGHHGAAHFLRCHKTVISLLDFCKKSGVEVDVKDESGYWEQRNEEDLRKTLRRNEGLMAAFGGLMKDLADTPGGSQIESPIFEYANFEHLEQEGWERFGNHFETLRKLAAP